MPCICLGRFNDLLDQDIDKNGKRETNQKHHFESKKKKQKRKKERKVTFLSMSRSRRSFTVQAAPLKIVVPNPKSASIFMSGSSALFAANAIDL